MRASGCAWCCRPRRSRSVPDRQAGSSELVSTAGNAAEPRAGFARVFSEKLFKKSSVTDGLGQPCMDCSRRRAAAGLRRGGSRRRFCRLRASPPRDYWDGYCAYMDLRCCGPNVSLFDPGSGKSISLLSDKNSLLRSPGNFLKKPSDLKGFSIYKASGSGRKS